MKEKAMTTNQNHTQRKSLASQIDRLESILGEMTEGLNGLIAGAVQEAVVIAVRQVVTEVLTNPDLHQQLHRNAVPGTHAQRIEPRGSLLRQCGTWLAGAAKSVCAKAVSALGKAWSWAAKLLGQGWQGTRQMVSQVCHHTASVCRIGWAIVLLLASLAAR